MAVFVFPNSALVDYPSLSQLKVFLRSLRLTYSFMLRANRFGTNDQSEYEDRNMAQQLTAYSSDSTEVLVPQGYYRSCQEVCAKTVE